MRKKNKTEEEALKLLSELDAHHLQIKNANDDLTIAIAKAEQAAQKFSRLYDFAPSGYFTLSREGRIVELNLSGACMLGKERSRLIGSLFGFFIADDKKAAFEHFLERTFNSESAEMCEVSITLNGDFPMCVYLTGIALLQEDACLITAVDITRLKKAEQALRFSEEKFRKTFDQSPVGAVIVGLDRKFVQCNSAFCNFLGYKPDEMMGKTIADVTFPDDQQIGANEMKQLREGQIEAASVIKRYVTRDGRVVWGELSISLLRDAQRLPLYYLTIIQDITQRKAAEENAELAYERIKRFTDSNIVGVIVADADGNIIETNDYYLDMLGFTRYDFENGLVDWRKITPPEWLPADEAAIIELREKGTCAPYEKEYYHRNGGRVFVLLTDALMPGGEQIIAYVLDITARKKAEYELQNSEQKYRAIFENVQDVFYQTDLNGIVTDISPSIKHFSEFVREDIIGKPVELLYFDPSDRNKLLKAITEKGELRDYELRLKTKNGNIKYTSINARLIFNENGVPHHIDGAIRDMTERKQHEEVLRKKSEDLEIMNSHFVGRELRMIELKKEINELLRLSGKDEKYVIH